VPCVLALLFPTSQVQPIIAAPVFPCIPYVPYILDTYTASILACRMSLSGWPRGHVMNYSCLRRRITVLSVFKYLWIRDSSLASPHLSSTPPRFYCPQLQECRNSTHISAEA
jgi:hypothetical protein